MSNWITTKELDKASAKSPVGHHVTALSLLTNATLNRKLSQLAQLISFFHFVRSSHEHTYDNHGSSGRCVGPVRLRERFARGPPPDALSTTVLRALAGGAAGVGSSVGARSPGLAFGLAVNASNREKCLERTTVRDAQGRVMSLAERSWRERPAFSKRASRADAVLGGYSALRFDRATRERISQTDCVLPAGDEALSFMRQRFPDRPSGGSVRELGALTSADFTGSFTCHWDQGANTLDCGGVQCDSGSSLRAVGGAKSRRGAAVSSDGGSPSGWYTCDNGCRIFGFMDGTGGWDCEEDDDWGGGGDGGNGGDQGGGSTGTGGDSTMVPPCEPGYLRELGECVFAETVSDTATGELLGCKATLTCIRSLRDISTQERSTFQSFLNGLNRGIPICDKAYRLGTSLLASNRVKLFDGPELLVSAELSSDGRNHYSVGDTHNYQDTSTMQIHISDHGVERTQLQNSSEFVTTSLANRLQIFKHEMTHVASQAAEGSAQKAVATTCGW